MTSAMDSRARKKSAAEVTDFSLSKAPAQSHDEIIFGRHAVVEALKSGRVLRRLCIARGSRGSIVDEIFERARSASVPFDLLDRAALDRIADSARHQGVLAYTAARSYVEFDELIGRLDPKNSLLVFLDGVQDPHNLGAIIRSAHAVGADGVVLEQRRSAGLTGAAVKASAGAVDYLPASRVTNLRTAMKTASKAGLWHIGLVTDGGDDFRRLDYRGACTLVIGGEGRGLRPSVRDACDFVARIPMASSEIGSLNASVAAGVVLYEAFRQRMPAEAD